MKTITHVADERENVAPRVENGKRGKWRENNDLVAISDVRVCRKRDALSPYLPRYSSPTTVTKFASALLLMV